MEPGLQMISLISFMTTVLQYPTALRIGVFSKTVHCRSLLTSSSATSTSHFHITPTTRLTPAGSQGRLTLPTVLDLTYRPISELAIVFTRQAVVANPNYAKFMHAMEQYWRGLRTITLPTITNLNVKPQTNSLLSRFLM